MCGILHVCTESRKVKYDKIPSNALFSKSKNITEIGSKRATNQAGDLYYDRSENKEFESLFMIRIKKKLATGLNLRANIGHNANVQEYSELTG